MPKHIALLLLCTTFLTAAGAPPRPVRVVVATFVQPGTTLTFSGTVQARTLADLAFRVGGKVVERLVEIGDHVHAGETLARLDPSDLSLSEQTARAALEAASADAANARMDLQRYGGMGRDSPAWLPSEYDRRIAASRMAAARLIQAERQSALAHDQSLYGSLAADAEGVITALPVQVGQVVTAGQTVASIAHTDQTEVVVDVPENRLDTVRHAGDVAIGLWATPGRILHGHVRELGALADPASRTFTVKIAVDDAPPGLLSLGMTASVRFAVSGKQVVLLPATALTDQEGKPAVWVLDPVSHRGRLSQIEISGYTADGAILVAGGLAAGEQVITAGSSQIEPDMQLVAWSGAAR